MAVKIKEIKEVLSRTEKDSYGVSEYQEIFNAMKKMLRRISNEGIQRELP